MVNLSALFICATLSTRMTVDSNLIMFVFYNHALLIHFSYSVKVSWVNKRGEREKREMELMIEREIRFTTHYSIYTLLTS